MIPKELYFIWVGKTNPPKWAINSFCAFYSVNQNFNPNIIHVTDFDLSFKDSFYMNYEINESSNIDLGWSLTNLYRNIDRKGSFINWKYKQNIDTLKIKNPNVILSDLLRFQLLHDYGGIYIDCDCFPIRSFDNKLLNRKQFFGCSYYGGIRFVRDNFFLGSVPGKWIDFSYRRVLMGDMCYPINFNIRNSENATRFYECELGKDDISIDKSYTKHGYIDHFFRRSWKN